MKKALLLSIILLGCKPNTSKKKYADFEIGIIADCQYWNSDTVKYNRYFKKSIKKLDEAVKTLNKKELDYTIHLGDIIDRDFKSFDSVLPIWNNLKSEKYHLLGNHDFDVADSLKHLVPAKMGLKNRYYSFTKNDWRFIVTDGNDLSFYGTLTERKKQETDSIFNLLKDKYPDNLKPWNGGLGNQQLKWVQNELEQAKNNNERVGIYCHFPAIRERDMHNLWNFKQFQLLIDKYDNVKFYFNGHNHKGDYVQKNGVHHLTFKGMVDTKDSTAYATVKFTNDSIFITGYGREISRSLKIK